LFIALAVGLGVVGLVLLLFPGTAIDIWPWKITRLLARVYSALFLGYALGGILCCWERRKSATRAVRLSSMFLGILVLVASAQHRDRFVSTRAELIWFMAFALLATVFLLSLTPLLFQRTNKGIAASPLGTAAPAAAAPHDGDPG
jgi:hypothetical protein